MPKIKKILVVEDEKPMARALELKLQHSGYEVGVVNDGVQALEKLSKESYDLLILDLMMPRMDGFTLLEELNKKGGKIPVIVSTNLSQEKDIARAKELGAVDYFIKSDTPLTEVIEHVKNIDAST